MLAFIENARESLLQRRGVLEVTRAGWSAAELREFEAIEKALVRIINDTYGRCARCDGAIGRQRLKALPEVAHCVDCAARYGGSRV